MEYYESLLSLGCFTWKDFIQRAGSEASAKWICREYQRKGYIERVKRDLYVVISLETQQPVASRYAIASHISEDSVVSYHSAFEYYGYANQVFYETHVTSTSRFKDFDYDGITYRRIAPRISSGIVTDGNGIRVTTLERTVIDCINLFDKIGGLEELLRCIALVPSLEEKELCKYLAEYDNGFLYQKAGYILSPFADSLGIGQYFFDECKSHIPKGKSYLEEGFRNQSWQQEWKLYAPADLMRMINKGVADNDAI